MNEQLIIDILSYLLREVFQSTFLVAVLIAMLTPKYNKYLLFIGMSAADLLLLALTKAFLPSELSIVVCALTVFFIPALLFFKDKKIRCFFAAAIEFTYMILSDALGSAYVFHVLNYYPYTMEKMTWVAVLSTVIFDIVFFPPLILIVFIWNRKLKNYHTKSMRLFALFPLGQTFFIAACTYPTWETGSLYDAFNNPYAPVAVLISVISDIMMFIALKDNNNLEAAKARAARAEMEMELQLQYYNELTEKMTEIREYRHDINNLVSAAEALITESSSAVSREFISEMKQKAEDMRLPVYSNNEIVNTVLWKKEQEADRLNVKFTVKANINEDFPLDKTDICSLFANLIDNALREASKTENRFVEVIWGRDHGLIIIEVINSVCEVKELGGKQPKSSQKGDHGHGMEIVKKIAEKYNGTFVFEIKEGRAQAAVSLMV